VCAGPIGFGVLGGTLWPGRTATAVVVGFAIPGAPMELEVRPGVNVLSERTLEPTVSLVLAFPGVPAGGWRR